jgi:hypothetical protein
MQFVAQPILDPEALLMIVKYFVLQLTQHPNSLEPNQTRELITHKQQIAHYSCLFVCENFH